MEKTLADYWRILVEENQQLLSYFFFFFFLPSALYETYLFIYLMKRDWYEPWSLLRSDEIVTVTGMLLGLNALDFNLCLKGDDLEKQPQALDWSLFLKDGNYMSTRRNLKFFFFCCFFPKKKKGFIKILLFFFSDNKESKSGDDPALEQQRKLNAALDQKGIYIYI